MRTPVLIVLAAGLGLGLGACDRGASPPPGGEPGPASTAGDDARNVTMRYDCGDGYSVAIMGDSARVATPGGERFELPRVPDTSPPVYADEAMELAIGSEDARLDRAEGGSLTCSPA